MSIKLQIIAALAPFLFVGCSSAPPAPNPQMATVQRGFDKSNPRWRWEGAQVDLVGVNGQPVKTNFLRPHAATGRVFAPPGKCVVAVKVLGPDFLEGNGDVSFVARPSQSYVVTATPAGNGFCVRLFEGENTTQSGKILAEKQMAGRPGRRPETIIYVPVGR